MFEHISNSHRYHDQRVFAGLSNGQLAVFRRDDDGTWATSDPRIIELAATSIEKVLPVSGKLWCATQNLVKVFNTITMEVEVFFERFELTEIQRLRD